MPTFLENLLIRRVTPRARRKFYRLTRCRKVVWDMPATARIRCARWRKSSEDFHPAKAQHWGCIILDVTSSTSDLLDEWAKGNVRQQRAAQYGRALQAMEAKKDHEARKTLNR
ncbi:hypothetical protein ACLK1T_21105 [Escherichia coli]